MGHKRMSKEEQAIREELETIEDPEVFLDRIIAQMETDETFQNTENGMYVQVAAEVLGKFGLVTPEYSQSILERLEKVAEEANARYDEEHSHGPGAGIPDALARILGLVDDESDFPGSELVQ